MTLQLKWCLHRGSVGQLTTAETHFTELSQCNIHCACIMHLTNKRNLILVNYYCERCTIELYIKTNRGAI